MSMETRLRASLVTVGVIWTDCLPRLLYSSFRLATDWLNVAGLKYWDCAKPKDSRFFLITSFCSIFAPVMFSVLMVGRSITVSKT